MASHFLCCACAAAKCENGQQSIWEPISAPSDVCSRVRGLDFFLYFSISISYPRFFDSPIISWWMPNSGLPGASWAAKSNKKKNMHKFGGKRRKVKPLWAWFSAHFSVRTSYFPGFATLPNLKCLFMPIVIRPEISRLTCFASEKIINYALELRAAWFTVLDDATRFAGQLLKVALAKVENQVGLPTRIWLELEGTKQILWLHSSWFRFLK